MDTFRTWIPRGFDFLTPGEARKFLELKTRIRAVFQEAGFAEVIPPAFDYERTFKLTTRGQEKSPLFEMRDQDGQNLAVRSDLTVQVIKAAASGRLGTQFPARLSYIQPVFQDRPWGSGHSREITQAGIELLGLPMEEGFPETLNLARTCMTSLGQDARIVYGDVRFLNRLFEAVPASYRHVLSEAFHYKDSARVRAACAEAGLDEDLSRILINVPLTFGDGRALDKLFDICRGRPELLEILQEARGVENVMYDMSLVRELSYYTGPVFEAYVAGCTEPILSGGVYDNLFQEFAGESRGACGFALNLSLLVQRV